MNSNFPSFTSHQKLSIVAAFALIFLIYIVFPTKHYYNDGIFFAHVIENSTSLNAALFYPNHLFYNLEMGAVWPAGAIVYYAAESADNNLFRYFNSNTIWKPLPRISQLESDISGIHAKGISIWLETTAIRLRTKAAAQIGSHGTGGQVDVMSCWIGRTEFGLSKLFHERTHIPNRNICKKAVGSGASVFLFAPTSWTLGISGDSRSFNYLFWR